MSAGRARRMIDQAKHRGTWEVAWSDCISAWRCSKSIYDAPGGRGRPIAARIGG